MVDDGLQRERLSQQPLGIIVYIPGSMQAVFDQSIELVARQMTNSCNLACGERLYAATAFEELHLASGRTLQSCTIAHRRDVGRSIVLIAANYRNIVSARLEESGATMKFLRLVWFWLRYTPLVFAILSMVPRPGHTRLTLAHRLFTFVSYVFVALALVLAL